MSPELQISLEKDFYKPGEVMKGVLIWNCSKSPKRIIYGLRWNTSGRGTTDKGELLKDEKLCLSNSGQQEFTIQIPQELAPSYCGVLISLQWEVFAQADISWAIDPKTSISVIISPTGAALSPGG